jgi:signal transduction histidine kinase/CheY-like chemotaxis protein
VEIRVRHRSGQWRHVEGLSHAIARDPDGRVTRVVGVMLDITERKRLEAQLLQAQKMEAIGRLTGGIAHDFNNMMQIVTGFAHRSLRELTLDSPMRANLERIREAAERAAGLTRQLLAFSRRQVLQPKVLDLNTVVTNAEKWLHRTLGEDVQLSTALNTKEARVKTDPVQLEQVLVNLAVNARDAMPRGGKLTVETATVTLGDRYPHDEHAVPPGKYVMLAVSDTGCGMDEETQSKIFEPFFTTKPGAKGTGLGLSTAYGVVRQSGGVIRVYSEPGRGTTFKIYLPFAGEQIEAEEDAAAAQEDVQGGSETILLVEDDERMREFTVLELQDLGYSVVQARNGEEAVRLCRDHDHSIDLLLIDVILPAMDGRKVADIIAAEHPAPATVYMSGYAEEHVVRQGFLIPGTHFLSKPFTPEQLAAKVREALRSTAATDKHAPRDNRSSPEQGTTRILMVDDDIDAAEPIAFVLGREGYEVEIAEDAATALNKAADMLPDIALVDIKLPDMDGCELAKRLRESSGDHPPLIIGASGYSPEPDQAAAFDHFLVKPIKFKKLRELLAARPEEA